MRAHGWRLARRGVTCAAALALAPTQAAQRGALAAVGRRDGVIPVFEYHVIAAGPTEFHHPPEELRADLELLYRRGYRPVTVAELVDRRLDELVPRGDKPFVAVFDDASPSQFRYQGREGVVDPSSAVGIWTRFTATHPGWRDAATFCVLSAGDAGGAFFGNGNIQGQRSAWRFPKLRFLVARGFELCNHTVWHARLDRYSDAYVQEQIARLALAVDSAVPGYRIRTFALPLGIWPHTRSLAWQGSWTDPHSRRRTGYRYDAVLEVAGGLSVSPWSPHWDAHSIDRIIASHDVVRRTVERLDRGNLAYVSAGAPAPVTRR